MKLPAEMGGKSTRRPYCWIRWLRGPPHWLQSLSNQSPPRRSWRGRRAPSPWSRHRGSTPNERFSLSFTLGRLMSFNAANGDIDVHSKQVRQEVDGDGEIPRCCRTLLPISQTSTGSLSPQQPVSASLCAGSSQVWNLQKNEMEHEKWQKKTLLIYSTPLRRNSSRMQTWGMAP